MEEDIVVLRRQLQEERRLRENEQRLRENEQRLRENEQRLRENEQRRREEAEAIAQLQTLPEYLQACHEFNLRIEVVEDATLTTRGDTTDPTGRFFPRRIVPWDGFASQQEEIWGKLSINPAFHSMRVFPSGHQLDYVRTLIAPISSETGLRNFERDTVEIAVQKVLDATYADGLLRRHLDLRGTVTFESHTNLGEDSSISQSATQMSIDEDNPTVAITGHVGTDAPTGCSPSCLVPMSHVEIPAITPKGSRKGKERVLTENPTKTRSLKNPRRARGKGQADQFCIYRTSEGRNIPAVAIEYKAPHKLSQQEIITGLGSEIQPEMDVINQEGEGFLFASRSLAAAVITQLFSYMIGKGIQYGYICTGQVLVFLYIPDDPTMVYYSVSVPNLDVQEDDESRLHHTAVSQVLAFILRALSEETPSQSWFDKTTSLDTWDVEYIDILSKIPETVRKNPPPSVYRPQRWRDFQRSPIQTRSHCQPPRDETRDTSDEDGDVPPSPSPSRPTNPRSSRRVSTQSTKQNAADRGGHKQRQRGSQMGIEDRPYCTQQCLLGVAYGGAIDRRCPNVLDHGCSHISLDEILRRIRAQLATDRENDADCKPLYLAGSRGALFKVRLSSHGYTLVAKGMEECDRRRLEHERSVYDQLRELQGCHVPVCLGTIDLEKSYYYNHGVYVCMLLLSWAGRPLVRCVNTGNKARLYEMTSIAVKALHRLRVLHGDAKARNILYNEENDNLMFVDFERSRLLRRQPLLPIRPNRGRKWVGFKGQGNGDEFYKELRAVLSHVSRITM